MRLSKSLFLSCLVFILALGFRLSKAQAAFDPAGYFEKKCSSCHTVGNGDDVGPDLKGVNERRTPEWLVQMIQSSQTLIKSGDPISNGLFNKFRQKKMPDQDLSADEVKQLLAYIKQGGPGEQPVDTKPATAATPEDIELGRELFLGVRRFANGGPACISCHSVGNAGPLGGGTLAADLTNVYSRYEDKSLSKALVKLGFPIMQEVFANHSLTPEEAFALKAFLYKEDQKGASNAGFQKKFVFLGLSVAVLLLGAIDLSWRKRRKKSAKPTHGGPL